MLELLETEPVRQRLFEIGIGLGPTGDFDAAHLKSLHRHIFQDVFEWAGHTRDERVVLSDGTVATEPVMRKAGGEPFLIGPAIPAALDEIAEKLREADFLRGLPRASFAEKAADVMSALNAAHPFREGNGRTQRVFVEQLAHGAGYDLDFTVVSRERMIRASIAAHDAGDHSMMRRLFDEISDPARAALLRKSIASLERMNFD
jgi:cell filamentation protein